MYKVYTWVGGRPHPLSIEDSEFAITISNMLNNYASSPVMSTKIPIEPRGVYTMCMEEGHTHFRSETVVLV